MIDRNQHSTPRNGPCRRRSTAGLVGDTVSVRGMSCRTQSQKVTPEMPWIAALTFTIHVLLHYQQSDCHESRCAPAPLVASRVVRGRRAGRDRRFNRPVVRKRMVERGPSGVNEAEWMAVGMAWSRVVRVPRARRPSTIRSCFYSPALLPLGELRTPEALGIREKAQVLTRPPIFGRLNPENPAIQCAFCS